jgi:hypothetical protein
MVSASRPSAQPLCLYSTSGVGARLEFLTKSVLVRVIASRGREASVHHMKHERETESHPSSSQEMGRQVSKLRITIIEYASYRVKILRWPTPCLGA